MATCVIPEQGDLNGYVYFGEQGEIVHITENPETGSSFTYSSDQESVDFDWRTRWVKRFFERTEEGYDKDQVQEFAGLLAQSEVQDAWVVARMMQAQALDVHALRSGIPQCFLNHQIESVCSEKSGGDCLELTVRVFSSDHRESLSSEDYDTFVFRSDASNKHVRDLLEYVNDPDNI